MTTLILIENDYSKNTVAIYSEAVAQRYKVIRQSRNLDNFKTLDKSEEYIFYVGTDIGREIGKQLGKSIIEPSFDWLVTLPCSYKQRNIELFSVAELSNYENKKGFYKPVDDKWFYRGVYENISIIDCTHSTDSDLILYSEIINFECEYRFFIKNRMIYTGSLYALNGELVPYDQMPFIDEAEYQCAKDFLHKLCTDESIQLVDHLVIDVGKIKNTNTWAVVEANPSYASGLYGCDPKLALYSLQKI